VRIVSFVLILIFVNPLSFVIGNADAEVNNYYNFGFYDSEPVTSQDNFTVSGYLNSELNQTSISWSISNFGSILVSNSLEFYGTEKINSLYNYDWEIEIIPSNIGICTCLITISTGINEMLTISKPIFIMDGTILNDSKTKPAISIISPVEELIYTNELLISGFVWNYDSTIPNVSWSINSVYLLEGQMTCQMDFIELFNISTRLIDDDSEAHHNSFKIDVDISNLDDGWYSLYVWSHDSIESNLINSELKCISIKIDNDSPIVVINYPGILDHNSTQESIIPEISLLENSPKLSIDGSVSTDPFWGRNGLSFVWTLAEIIPNIYNDDYNVEVIEIISGNDQKVFLLTTDKSGLFRLTLSVSDLSGNIDSKDIHILITNLNPIAKLKINGQDVIDGDDIILSEFNELILDATNSSDTANDMESLNCIWKVNNIPYYEDCYRKFIWPESVTNDKFTLTLEVSDDDGLISHISIAVLSDEPNNNGYYMILLLIISIIFVSYAFYKRFNVLEDNIPKW
jgi:hypothetical protein